MAGETGVTDRTKRTAYFRETLDWKLDRNGMDKPASNATRNPESGGTWEELMAV
jgi:hypothetical protein